MSEIFTPQNGEDSNDDRPRLVLDTNTVLALWMFRDPKLEALRGWIESGKCRLFSREDALEELRRVLAYRQFQLGLEEQSAIRRRYCQFLAGGTLLSTAQFHSEIPQCRDPDDQKFLEIALQAQAGFLISRDKALLALRRKSGVKGRLSIASPEAFMNTLALYPSTSSN